METNYSDLHRQWTDEGYIVGRRLIEPQRAERLRGICDRVLARWIAREAECGRAGNANSRAMRNSIDPDLSPGRRDEVIELLEFGADPRILQVVRASTGFEPMFRGTSYFFNPADGTDDGNWHRDSQFMTKTDEAEMELILQPNYSMQLQIAFVASEDSQYVPGSHLRSDTPEEYRIRKSDNQAHARSNDMPGAIRVQLEPGDAVAFNPMGLHRGRYHANKLRRTYMLTYTAEHKFWRDQLTMQPWFAEPGYLDGVSADAHRFYQRFIDTFRQDWPAPATTTARMASPVTENVRAISTKLG